MRAFAVNGQTATIKGFSSILYRATALLAGFDAGTFLTEKAADVGGFTFEGQADFDSRWTGGGSDVIHPNFHTSRLIPVRKIPRETARVLRWSGVDGEVVTMAHRVKVASLAKERHGKRDAFLKAFGAIGAALLAQSSDSEAISLAVAMLQTPDESADRRAWRKAFQAAKEAHFLTI